MTATGLTQPEIDQEVVTFLNQRVHHPRFSGALEAIEHCHRMGLHAMEEPRCLLIVGESGCGKSTLRKDYGRRFPRIETEDRTEIPVLHLELTPQPTIKSVAENVLLEFGDPFATKGSAEGKTARIVKLIKECRVQLVILDEFQHFVDNAGMKVESRVADWLKHLINATKVPFVLMGLPRCQRILHVNEQLRRRFSSKLVLERFRLNDVSSRKQFAGVLRSLDERLPLSEPSELTNPEVMTLVYYATHGLIAYMSKLIEDALRIALESRATRIDLPILEAAFTRAIWNNGVGPRNPFSRDFEVRPLNKEGEPFYGYAF